jgi:hypothetical protein
VIAVVAFIIVPIVVAGVANDLPGDVVAVLPGVEQWWKKARPRF